MKKNFQSHYQFTFSLFLLCAAFALVQAQPVSITGEITGDGGQGIAGCTVALSDSSHITATSTAQGTFTLTGDMPVSVFGQIPELSSVVIRGTDMRVQVSGRSVRVKLSLHDISGVSLSDIFNRELTAGDHTLSLPEPHNVMAQGIAILRIEINGISHTIKWNRSARTAFTSYGAGAPARKQAAVEQSLDIACEGYEDQQVALDSYEMDLGAIVMAAVQSGPIEHIGTTEIWDADGKNVPIDIPEGTQEGDLLLLALHRTDDDLPMYVEGWTHAGSCFKSGNGDDKCGTEETCEVWHNDNFCERFQHGPGHDLCQSIHYRAATADEPQTLHFELDFDGSSHVGWIILTTLRNAATTDAVRDWAGESSDDSPRTKFPSVLGEAGDALILSQSFDDFEPEGAFTAPDGMEYWGYVGNSDETGYLYGEILTESGQTGVRTTNGGGASNNKDGQVSMTIKPK